MPTRLTYSPMRAFAVLLALPLLFALACDDKPTDSGAHTHDNNGNGHVGPSVDNRVIYPEAPGSRAPAELVGEWYDARNAERFAITKRQPNASSAAVDLQLRVYREETFSVEFAVAPADAPDPGAAMLILEGSQVLYRHSPAGPVDAATWPGANPALALIGEFGEVMPSGAAGSARRRLIFAARDGLTGRVIERAGAQTYSDREGTYFFNATPNSAAAGTLNLRWLSDNELVDVSDGVLSIVERSRHHHLQATSPAQIDSGSYPELTLGDTGGPYACVAPMSDVGAPRPLVTTLDVGGVAREIALLGTFRRLDRDVGLEQIYTFRADGAFISESRVSDAQTGSQRATRGRGSWTLEANANGRDVDLLLELTHRFEFEIHVDRLLRLTPTEPTEEVTLRFFNDSVMIGAQTWEPATSPVVGATELAPGSASSGELIGTWRADVSFFQRSLAVFADGRFIEHLGGDMIVGRIEHDREALTLRWYRARDLQRDGR